MRMDLELTVVCFQSEVMQTPDSPSADNDAKRVAIKRIDDLRVEFLEHDSGSRKVCIQRQGWLSFSTYRVSGRPRLRKIAKLLSSFWRRQDALRVTHVATVMLFVTLGRTPRREVRSVHISYPNTSPADQCYVVPTAGHSAECTVARAGEMVRAVAPMAVIKYRDPLPPFHCSVCIRRNFQSEKEQKVTVGVLPLLMCASLK